jgi:hypothetical protein
MSSKCCEKVVGKVHHIVVITSPLPKTKIPILFATWELLLLLLPKFLLLTSAHCG